MKRLLLFCAVVFATMFSACTEDESSPVGDVYGIVSDLKSGAPVRNAEVIISPSNASTVSGSDGHFEFKSLTPGQYKISVEANGYSSNSRQVTVVAGQRISCDIHLAPEADNDVISINPTSIDFGTNELQIAATVTNESDTETEWFLDLGDTPWLYAYPTTGRIGGGKTHSIVFTANRARMNEDKSSVVNISAFGNTHPLSLKCKQSVQLSSVMVVESLNVDFGEEATEQIIRIRNISETDVNWTLYKVQSERLSMSATHGIVAPGGSQIVTIRLDREGLDEVLATTFMISDGTVDQPVNVIAYPTPEGATTTNKIFYTSIDGNIVEPYNPSAFGANIVSNTYEYGQGVIVFDGDVTEIGYMAFYECATLASITIPETILEIANHAFTRCSAMISINLPNSIKRQIGAGAFDGCTSLTSIVIPGDIELIQDNAFGGCTSLTTVTILGRISDFSDGVFRDCINLSSFNGEYASTDNRCLIIDGRLAAFAPAGLTSYSIPEGVTSIGRYAFLRCENLTNVTLPNSLERIGIGAFQSCHSLNNVVIPNSVKIIDGDAFGYCYAFTEFTIPDSVESIGEDEIFGTRCSILRCCHSLTTINSKYASSDKRCLIIDGKLNSFAGSDLDTYVIPNGVTAIEKSAFEKQHLINVTIPESVTYIGMYAFYNMWEMTSVTIPSNVEHIGESAFYACGNLAEVICTPTTPPTLAPRVFSEVKEDCKIYVPAGTYDAYVSAEGWSEYKDMIVKTNPIEGSKIYYTSTDGNIVIPNILTPNEEPVFDANIVSNVYENGQGVITFDNKISKIGEGAFDGNSTLKSIIIPDDVTGIDNWVFRKCSNLVSIDIPESVYVINQAAFLGCTSLTDIVLPKALTWIALNTFYNCSSLQSITIPSSVTTIDIAAFQGCSNLTRVDCLPITPPSIGTEVFDAVSADCKIYVPDGTYDTYISAEDWAEYKDMIVNPNASAVQSQIFYTSTDGAIVEPKDPSGFGANIVSNVYENNQGIITFDGEVTSIGSQAFYDCSGLTSINIPDAVTSIGSNAFYGCSGLTSIEIPDGVTLIGSGAFDSCSGLTSVNIPDTVTTIEGYTFRGCSGLTSITIPDGTMYIGENAFSGTGLTKVAIPESVNFIGYGAFMACRSLSSINIPSGVTEISGATFHYCDKLTSITIPNSVTVIGDSAFQYSGLMSISIPNSVTTIGATAFFMVVGLTSVTIPDSVTSIGEGAFARCGNMKSFKGKYASEDGRMLIVDGVLNSIASSSVSYSSLIVPDNVTSIGGYAFIASTLYSITIPANVTSIGYAAFADCGHLSSIYCKPLTAPELYESAFNDTSTSLQIYVPTASVDAYKAAEGWSEYADKIVGYDF